LKNPAEIYTENSARNPQPTSTYTPWKEDTHNLNKYVKYHAAVSQLTCVK